MTNLARSLVFCGLLWAWPAVAQPPELRPIVPEKKPIRVPFLTPVTWLELEKQIGGATLVSLHAREMPALQVFENLSAQTPFAVKALNPTYWPNRKPNTFSGDYEAQPFWFVAREVALQLKVKLSDRGARGVDFIADGNENSGLDARSGPTLFTVFNAAYQHDIALGARENASSESLVLNGKVYFDPKLYFPQQTLVFHLEEALDERGQSLLPAKDIEIHYGGTNDTTFNFALPLPPPAQRGGTLKSLRGQIHCVVPLRSLHWEIPDVFEAGAQEKIFPQDGDVGEVRVELEPVNPEGDAHRVSIFISQDGALPEGYRRLSTGKEIMLGSIELYSSVDVRDNRGYGMSSLKRDSQVSGDEQTRLIAYTTLVRPQNNYTSEGARLVLDYHFDWRELVVPFAFENIALP